jgi:FKBP12-rapamycin complex-associated protein
MDALIELIRHAPRVVRPYVHAVIDAVLLKLSDVNSDVFPLALVGMGELCKVDDVCVAERMPTLAGLILEVLHDQSSVGRKEDAIRVLGQLAQQTGAVTKLYTDYPSLMPTLTAVLNESTNHLLKLETLKVFGILGALDPHEEKLLRLGEKQPTGAPSDAPGRNNLTIAQQARSSPSGHPVGTEEYFLELVVRELVAIA